MFLSGLRASMALEEGGMCGAVESGEPSLRALWISHSKLRDWNGLHHQNKDCLQESGHSTLQRGSSVDGRVHTGFLEDSS